jgi:hypothetical protein
MMMTSGQAVKYKSSIDCFQQVVKNEGVKSLFKGAGANILRAVAGAGVLSGYDQLQVIMFGERAWGGMQQRVLCARQAGGVACSSSCWCSAHAREPRTGTPDRLRLQRCACPQPAVCVQARSLAAASELLAVVEGRRRAAAATAGRRRSVRCWRGSGNCRRGIARAAGRSAASACRCHHSWCVWHGRAPVPCELDNLARS